MGTDGGTGSKGSTGRLPCLEPICAARLGSRCREHLTFPTSAHAPHLLPFLFFAEHRLDIVQILAICRFSQFNGRVPPLLLRETRMGFLSISPVGCLDLAGDDGSRKRERFRRWCSEWRFRGAAERNEIKSSHVPVGMRGGDPCGVVLENGEKFWSGEPAGRIGFQTCGDIDRGVDRRSRGNSSRGSGSSRGGDEEVVKLRNDVHRLLFLAKRWLLELTAFSQIS